MMMVVVMMVMVVVVMMMNGRGSRRLGERGERRGSEAKGQRSGHDKILDHGITFDSGFEPRGGGLG